MEESNNQTDQEKIMKEKINNLLKILKNQCIPSSPMYSKLKKQIAEYNFELNNHLEGIKYLIDSIGTKLKFDILQKQIDCEINDDKYKNKDVLEVFNEIPFESETIEDLMNQIKTLPEEWSIVQITRVSVDKDVLHCLNPYQKGILSFEMSKLRLVVINSQYEPFQVLIDKPKGMDNNMKSFFDLINESLQKLFMECDKKKSREDASQLIKDVSDGLNDSWLCKYQCLLPGIVNSKQLNNKLKSIVHNIILNYKLKPSLNVIFMKLLSGIHLINNDDVYDLIRNIIEDSNTNKINKLDDSTLEEIYKQFIEFKKQHETELSSISRHPVILMLDDELDRLPWETTKCLRSSPVSRVHCLNVLIGLFQYHKKNIVNGYHIVPIRNKDDLFIISNPNNDISSLELLQSFCRKKFNNQFTDISNRAPSKYEFFDGLSHTLFIYCGHGSGTMYAPVHLIGRSKVKAVSFLFGCRSVAKVYEGGRLPFSSLAETYFTAGSPCVLGMLWNITTKDCDRMAANLLNITFPKVLDLKTINPNWKNVSNEYSSNMLTNCTPVRTSAVYFFNSAALVVWGLPIKFTT